MLKFESRDVVVDDRLFNIPCLVEGPEDMPNEDVIAIDGYPVPVPAFAVRAARRALQRTRINREKGYGVDCTMFAAEMVGADCRPVDRKTYFSVGSERTGSGVPLTREDAADAPNNMQLVVFGSPTRASHTAVRLPIHDLFLQQLGPDSPVAITGIATIFKMFACDSAMVMNQMTDTINGHAVVSYDSGSARV